MKAFEHKLLNHFQRQFRVYIPKDILKKECLCPKQLVDYFGRTSFVLRQRLPRDEEEQDRNPKIYKRNIPAYMYLAIFVMNRIPSDIYRLKNPKLEIETDSKGFKTVKVHHKQKKDQKKKKEKALRVEGVAKANPEKDKEGEGVAGNTSEIDDQLFEDFEEVSEGDLNDEDFPLFPTVKQQIYNLNLD